MKFIKVENINVKNIDTNIESYIDKEQKVQIAIKKNHILSKKI